MGEFTNMYIQKYLENRNNDESYSVAVLTASYWLYHADHDPLGENLIE